MPCGCATRRGADGKGVTCGCSRAELIASAARGDRLDVPGQPTADPSSIPCGVGEPAGLLHINGNLRPRETTRGPTQLTPFGAFEIDSNGNAFNGLTEAIRQGLREGRWEKLLSPQAGALRPAGPSDLTESPCACTHQDAILLLPLLASSRMGR